jgi:hypothetical protein
VLADGARADVFEQLLAAGELPAIDEHVVRRGSYRRGSSVFTSTTGPAHIPLVTGCFPGTANVPGIRWFERERYRPGLPFGPWCLRTYCNPEAWWMGRDLDPVARTLGERAGTASEVFGVLVRGVPLRGRMHRVRKNLLWVQAHRDGDYSRVDDRAADYLTEAVGRRDDVTVAVFPAIDWHSHYPDAGEAATIAAYRGVDRAVGRAAAVLLRQGDYDRTLIVVCSDHGHSAVDQHFDLPVRLEQDHGLRVAYHSWRLAPQDPQGVVCVSGNGMAHVYLRVGDWRHRPTRGELDAAYDGVRERLLTEPAIDLILTRADEPGWLHVESRRGAALLREERGAIAYRPLSTDPFGLPPLAERMSHDEALRATVDSDYPDGLLQAAQIFRSRRCGDLVVSAIPGHDLRERWEHPEHHSAHGSLHRAHMHVPLAFSRPVAEGPVRTADVAATALAHLDRAAVAGELDGVSRLA